MLNNPIKLISKTTGEVSAYHDSAVFFAIKGHSVDRQQEGLPLEPYGIIPSKYDNPFSLEFDETNLTVSIKPGILQVYGRQVELDQAVEVYDFHSTVESQLMYCTIFIEIGLEDMTLQVAKLKIDIAGAGYKNFDANATRDNLYKLNHGVFQAPIIRFQYAPSAETHFTDETLIMPILEVEAREAVREITLDGKINGVDCEDLWSIAYDPALGANKSPFKYWLKAENVDALAAYKAASTHTAITAGYSVAATAEALGDTDTHDTTAISSSLTGVLTVVRKKVINLGTWFGTNANNEVLLNVNTSKLQLIRIHFTKKSFTAKVNYQRKYLFTGWQWQDQYPDSVTITLVPDAERWVSGSQRFCLYYYHWFYVIAGAGWHSEEGMKFGTYEEFQAQQQTEDGPNWSQGSTSMYSINTKRRFMDVYLTKESGGLRFKFEGRGYGAESYEFLEGWWRWCPLQDVTDAGDMYVNLIYKGDVRK